MRADVKLGVILSAVLVLVAGGYYLYRDRGPAPIPVSEESIAAAGKPDPAAGRTPVRPSPTPIGQTTRPGQGTTPADRSAGTRPQPVDPNRRQPVQPRPNVNRPRVVEQDANRATKPTVVPPQSQESRPRDRVADGEPRRPVPRPIAPTGPSEVTPTGEPETAGQDARMADSGPARPGRSDVSQPAGTAPSRPATEDQVAQRPTSAPESNNRPIPLSAQSPVRPEQRTPSTRPAVEPDRPGEAAVEMHRVQPGDTFSSLAQTYYGSQRHAQYLVDNNPEISDPTRLRVGMMVRIPAAPTTTSSARQPDGRPAVGATGTTGTARTYVVQSGDSFYKIARDRLGDANRWKELLELNHTLVGGDPRQLRVGQTVVLPEK